MNFEALYAQQMQQQQESPEKVGALTPPRKRHEREKVNPLPLSALAPGVLPWASCSPVTATGYASGADETEAMRQLQAERENRH